MDGVEKIRLYLNMSSRPQLGKSPGFMCPCAHVHTSSYLWFPWHKDKCERVKSLGSQLRLLLQQANSSQASLPTALSRTFPRLASLGYQHGGLLFWNSAVQQKYTVSHTGHFKCSSSRILKKCKKVKFT